MNLFVCIILLWHTVHCIFSTGFVAFLSFLLSIHVFHLTFVLFVCLFSSCFSGLIQTTLYADFFYYYFIRYSTSIPILSVLYFTLSIIIITQAL
uniref:Uncharacterized protein n=1 Tax=Lactuca sativa TaxID=4236 RepID=A0A9R1UDP8_LACSA|nr:hypothetical protein LSAT_V11C900486600 [Lactuca sativa]